MLDKSRLKIARRIYADISGHTLNGFLCESKSVTVVNFDAESIIFWDDYMKTIVNSTIDNQSLFNTHEEWREWAKVWYKPEIEASPIYKGRQV